MNNIKTKRYICVWICAIAVITVILVIFFMTQNSAYSKADFVDNGKNEQYAQGVPLDEMDFSAYERYVRTNHTLLLINYTKNIALPCDIYYYAHVGDREPVLTLKKGTEVYVLPSDVNDFFEKTLGYGLQCWPDYQKGWRYGQPFVTDADATATADAPKYYVKTSELKVVAKAFYKKNKKPLQQVSASDYANWIVLDIDRRLYKGGVFCSEDL